MPATPNAIKTSIAIRPGGVSTGIDLAAAEGGEIQEGDTHQAITQLHAREVDGAGPRIVGTAAAARRAAGCVTVIIAAATATVAAAAAATVIVPGTRTPTTAESAEPFIATAETPVHKGLTGGSAVAIPEQSATAIRAGGLLTAETPRCHPPQ
ncbi:hypothetical protein [Candidatus Competibacter phosphatis]|uniref:hypothetical protein n=1 Tax=Candidatus Competibacter phosphatis TaxID=221280 RepID=UPI0024839F14|nr:hypothetical protein [Candidatus Competibacter phosphatis]